jgi:hypothetical protein
MDLEYHLLVDTNGSYSTQDYKGVCILSTALWVLYIYSAWVRRVPQNNGSGVTTPLRVFTLKALFAGLEIVLLRSRASIDIVSRYLAFADI